MEDMAQTAAIPEYEYEYSYLCMSDAEILQTAFWSCVLSITTNTT